MYLSLLVTDGKIPISNLKKQGLSKQDTKVMWAIMW